jgi:hypothetical protein
MVQVGGFNMKGRRSKGVKRIALVVIAVVAIFAALTPMPVAARKITVDGDLASYPGEWVAGDYPAGDRWATDPANDVAGGDIYGYDLRALWGHYDEANDTMYFRLDVDNLPADLDGDGNTDTVCTIPPGDCGGVSATEQYTLILSDNVKISGKPGATLAYTNNSVAHPDGKAQYGADGTNDCVEFELLNAADYIDPADFCILVAAGGIADLPGEDTMEFCLSEPPEVGILTPFGIITLLGILSILGLRRLRRN